MFSHNREFYRKQDAETHRSQQREIARLNAWRYGFVVNPRPITNDKAAMIHPLPTGTIIEIEHLDESVTLARVLDHSDGIYTVRRIAHEMNPSINCYEDQYNQAIEENEVLAVFETVKEAHAAQRA